MGGHIIKYRDREWNSQDVAVDPTRTRKGRAAEYQIREIDLISSSHIPYGLWSAVLTLEIYTRTSRSSQPLYSTRYNKSLSLSGILRNCETVIIYYGPTIPYEIHVCHQNH